MSIVQSRNYTPGRRGVKPRLIVIHTMEAPETHGRAAQVAAWFAGPTAPESSVHYCVDDTTVVQTLNEHDTAWAVADGDLNRASISIEHAGYASQNAHDWADPYSTAMLARSARLTARIAARWHIPLVHVTPAQIAAGKAGICGHADITVAKHIAGGHMDPGPNFPWPKYMQLVKAAAADLAKPAAPQKPAQS